MSRLERTNRDREGGRARYALCYDKLLGDAAQPALNWGWSRAKRYLNYNIGAAVDIGCGTGRFLPVLRQTARRLYAVDTDPTMLAIARRRNPEATFFQQDMRALHLPEPCALATCRFAAVNYLRSWHDLECAIRSIAAALATRGLLVFDVIVRRPPFGPSTAWKQHVACDDSMSIWHHRISPQAGHSTTVIRWFNQNGEHLATDRHSQNWFPLAGILARLRRFGFVVLDCAWLPRGGPTNWLQIIAQRESGGLA